MEGEREREKERKRESEREKLSLIWMPEGITYFHAKFQVNILKNKRLFTTLNAFVEIIISRNKGKCIFALPLLRQNWIEQECPRCWVYLLADYLKNMQNRKKNSPQMYTIILVILQGKKTFYQFESFHFLSLWLFPVPVRVSFLD